MTRIAFWFGLLIVPVILIPLIFVLFPARFTGTGNLLAALLCYLIAKGLELLDRQVYAQGQIVSGHTLKHLMAAMASYFILHSLQRRRRFGGEQVNVA